MLFYLCLGSLFIIGMAVLLFYDCDEKLEGAQGDIDIVSFEKELYRVLALIVLDREPLDFTGMFDLLSTGSDINEAIEVLNRYEKENDIIAE